VYYIPTPIILSAALIRRLLPWRCGIFSVREGGAGFLNIIQFNFKETRKERDH
jgi:hypothetical protein